MIWIYVAAGSLAKAARGAVTSEVYLGKDAARNERRILAVRVLQLGMVSQEVGRLLFFALILSGLSAITEGTSGSSSFP